MYVYLEDVNILRASSILNCQGPHTERPTQPSWNISEMKITRSG